MPKVALDQNKLGVSVMDDELAHHLADLEHDVAHHTELPRTAVSNFLEKIIDWIGGLTSWFWILAIGAILYSVISRYVFAQGSVMLEEIQWHLAGAAWLIGLSYTSIHDDHVRVDVLHENLSLKAQGWIEFFGLLFLLLPFLVLALVELYPYAMSSFEQNERSQAPAGLPMRWVLKSILPFSFLLLFLASIARLLRTMSLLFNFPKSSVETNNSVEEA